MPLRSCQIAYEFKIAVDTLTHRAPLLRAGGGLYGGGKLAVSTLVSRGVTRGQRETEQQGDGKNKNGKTFKETFS